MRKEFIMYNGKNLTRVSKTKALYAFYGGVPVYMYPNKANPYNGFIEPCIIEKHDELDSFSTKLMMFECYMPKELGSYTKFFVEVA